MTDPNGTAGNFGAGTPGDLLTSLLFSDVLGPISDAGWSLFDKLPDDVLTKILLFACEQFAWGRLEKMLSVTMMVMQTQRHPKSTQQNLPELDGPEGISSYFKRIEDSEYAARKQWMDLALVCHRWLRLCNDNGLKLLPRTMIWVRFPGKAPGGISIFHAHAHLCPVTRGILRKLEAWIFLVPGLQLTHPKQEPIPVLGDEDEELPFFAGRCYRIEPGHLNLYDVFHRRSTQTTQATMASKTFMRLFDPKSKTEDKGDKGDPYYVEREIMLVNNVVFSFVNKSCTGAFQLYQDAKVTQVPACSEHQFGFQFHAVTGATPVCFVESNKLRKRWIAALHSAAAQAPEAPTNLPRMMPLK